MSAGHNMSSAHGMTPPDIQADPTRVMHATVLVVFSFLAVVAVALRLWARKIQGNVYGLSDYLIISGLIWGLGLSLFTAWSSLDGQLGANASQSGNPQAMQNYVVLQLKSLIVGQLTWQVSVVCIRASVITLYIHVFRTPLFRKAGYGVLFANVVYFVSAVLATCLICRPFAFTWNKEIRNGTCGDQEKLDLYLGICNLLLDIAVVVLPMPVLWGLQMALNKKVSLSIMFGLGIIICSITLVRIIVSSENHGSNSQEVYALVSLYTSLETLLGTINACLPVLKPIVNKLSSTKASTWASSVMSGSIPIFMRRSQIGSAWKSKRSTYRQPGGEELPPWSPSHRKSTTTPAGNGQSPPPRYVDTRGDGLKTTFDTSSKPTPEVPKPPVPPKERVYSPTRRWQPGDEKEDNAIYVERTWDVERGGSADSDEQGLVKGAQRW